MSRVVHIGEVVASFGSSNLLEAATARGYEAVILGDWGNGLRRHALVRNGRELYRGTAWRCLEWLFRRDAKLVALGKARAAAVAPEPERYFVRYYDAKLSKRGQGSQIRRFTDRAEAEAFAARHRYRARPARVETER